MRAWQWVVLCVTVALWANHDARALPRFALAEGEGCHDCHLNPSGGGLRNDYGTDGYGRAELPADERRAISTWVTNNLRVGGDIRTQGYGYLDDLPEGEPEDTRTTSGGFMMQADLYAYFKLNDNMRVYIEEDILRRTREVFGIVGDKEGEKYVKVGAFAPNYGLRIDDHTAFTRGGNPRAPRLNPPEAAEDGLFWEPNRADKGIELGAEVADIYVTAGVFNNGPDPTLPDPDGDKAFLARGETYLELGSLNAMIGANAYVGQNGLGTYVNKNVELADDMILVGGFAGVGNDSWTLMAEVDLADNYLATAADDEIGAKSLAIWTEATLKLNDGLYLVGRAELFDPDTDAGDDQFTRETLGFEWYPVPYFELKPTLRYTNQPTAAPDLGEALLQAHWWF